MKSIISSLKIGILFIFIMSALLWIDYLVVDSQKLQYDYALRTAVADATMLLQKDNYETAKNMQLDGHRNEASNRMIDKSIALNRFTKSLYLNVTNRQISSEHLPVRAIVSNDGIDIYTGGNGWLIKTYFHYDYSGVRYMFTLGDTLKVRNLISMTLSESKLQEMNQIRSDMTNEQLRDYIVMRTVVREINKVLLSELNIQTENEHYGYKLDASSYDRITRAGETLYNSDGNVIEGPCFIAVIDEVSIGISGQKKYRKVEIGGAEIRLK